jgi:hypothetical protein
MNPKHSRRRKKELKRRRKAQKTRAAKVRQARRHRLESRAEDSPTIPDGYSTPLMKNFAFENPFFGMTEEQRCEFAKSFGASVAKKFDEGLGQLVDAVKKHDPVELLATSAFYCLFKGVGPDTDFTDEGPYQQAIIEVLQSICLQHADDEFGSLPMLHPYLFRILDLSKECSKDFALRRFSALAEVDPDKRAVLMAIEGARLHTQMMRNWGYPQHMRKITHELLEPFEDEVHAQIGIGLFRSCL